LNVSFLEKAHLRPRIVSPDGLLHDHHDIQDFLLFVNNLRPGLTEWKDPADLNSSPVHGLPHNQPGFIEDDAIKLPG
jgi:hypothetical protein